MAAAIRLGDSRPRTQFLLHKPLDGLPRHPKLGRDPRHRVPDPSRRGLARPLTGTGTHRSQSAQVSACTPTSSSRVASSSTPTVSMSSATSGLRHRVNPPVARARSHVWQSRRRVALPVNSRGLMVVMSVRATEGDIRSRRLRDDSVGRSSVCSRHRVPVVVFVVVCRPLGDPEGNFKLFAAQFAPLSSPVLDALGSAPARCQR
jgi:hypothetical protein